MEMAAESHNIQECPNAHSLNFLLYLSHFFAIEAFLLYLHLPSSRVMDSKVTSKPLCLLRCLATKNKMMFTLDFLNITGIKIINKY